MTESTAVHSAEAGAAIYNRWILSIYDVGVIRVSNRFAWRCPSPLMLDFYNRHVTANHLDVGVGTGYFPDHCRFPSATPRIALMDLNPNSLRVTAARLRRYNPSTHVANILEPIQWDAPKFDSIGLNYVLHCLPGDLPSKSAALAHLAGLLNPGGVLFGSTILGQGIQPNFLARRLIKVYNAKGIFSNTGDHLDDLNAILRQTLREVQTKVVGCVAFFEGKV
jgi:SAM-dependent methyltransferase